MALTPQQQKSIKALGPGSKAHEVAGFKGVGGAPGSAGEIATRASRFEASVAAANARFAARGGGGGSGGGGGGGGRPGGGGSGGGSGGGGGGSQFGTSRDFRREEQLFGEQRELTREEIETRQALTGLTEAQIRDIAASRSQAGTRLRLEEELGRGQLGLSRDRFGLEEELGRGGLALRGELGRGELDLSRDRFGLKRDLVGRLFDDGAGGGGDGALDEQDILEQQLRERAGTATTPESIAADPRTGVARLSSQRQSERSRARLAAQGTASGVNPLESGSFQSELNKLDLARAEDEAAFESGIFGEQEAERGRARTEALELGERRKSRRLARELARQQQQSSLIATL